MAMFVDHLAEFDLSYYSPATTTTATTTTTTTTSSSEDDIGCNWDDWSPMVDWEALTSGPHEDFLDCTDSMTDNQTSPEYSAEVVYENNSSTLSPDDTLMMIDDDTNGDLKGLKLVHLLMAAAEALTGVNKSCELARVILVRLKELASPTEGSNMERLAAYFTEALLGLLDGCGGAHSKNHLLISGPYHHRDEHHNQMDVLAAFQLLQDMSPFVKFGHFTANQAILEAVAQDKRVHIVDYDIMEGIQWASLMQALVSRKDGPPTPHLRITAISRAGSARKSIATVQETGRRLVAFAASIGQPFSFHQCRLDSDETFKPSSLKLVKGEVLIINCMLHLPHFNYRSPNSVASFLSEAKSLNPRLVTLVEEELCSTQENDFMGRFMDLLHHYSAVYDSLEAGFPLQGRARALVERVFLGPQIVSSLARIYRINEERKGFVWGDLLSSIGFRPMNISFANNCQAKLLLGLFNDGYRVEELATNKLVLTWKLRRLLSASIWSCSGVEL